MPPPAPKVEEDMPVLELLRNLKEVVRPPEEGICIRRRCLSIVPPLIPELEEDPKTSGPVLLLASRGEVVTTLSFGTIRGEGEGGSSSAVHPGPPA